jgi:hypothetical protein
VEFPRIGRTSGWFVEQLHVEHLSKTRGKWRAHNFVTGDDTVRLYVVGIVILATMEAM